MIPIIGQGESPSFDLKLSDEQSLLMPRHFNESCAEGQSLMKEHAKALRSLRGLASLGQSGTFEKFCRFCHCKSRI
jgi:hypothetical protein